MSTMRQRRAFLLHQMADQLIRLADDGFHSVSVPIWPFNYRDRRKMVLDARRQAAAYRVQAEKLVPGMNKEEEDDASVPLSRV